MIKSYSNIGQNFIFLAGANNADLAGIILLGIIMGIICNKD